MMPRETFKTALQDPVVAIDVVAASRAEEIAKLVRELAPGEYVSEWRHTLGEVRYEYHRHTGSTAASLNRLYTQGIRGGNPRLTNIYSQSDLERIIRPEAVSNS